ASTARWWWCAGAATSCAWPPRSRASSTSSASRSPPASARSFCPCASPIVTSAMSCRRCTPAASTPSTSGPPASATPTSPTSPRCAARSSSSPAINPSTTTRSTWWHMPRNRSSRMRSAQSLPDLAPALEISVHRGDLAALAADWDALFDPAHPGAVFRSWAWISAWWNSFSIGREPFVLLAREHGATVGILPLCSERSALGGRRLVFLGEGIVGSDYLGIVCRAGDEPRLADAFAHALARESFDELSLDGILRGDPLLPALEGVLPASRAEVELRYKCPHITLAGDFDRYLATLPDGTGAQWKRRLRWLEKRPGFEIE